MGSPLALIIAIVAMLCTVTVADQPQPHPGSQQQIYAPRTAANPRKRAPSICEETYGPGSVSCGDEKASMCYNPSIGQSCCSDNGYCDRGQYCAPVPGYCCLDNEDLQACAKNAGFELPSSIATLTTTDLSTNSSTTKPGENTSTSTPYVQVSAVGGKERWTLVWMSLGIGIVGVIMTTF